MKPNHRLLFVTVAVMAITASAYAQRDTTIPRRDVRVGADAARDNHVGRFTPSNQSRASVFIENRGQWDTTVQYLLRGDGLNTWVTSDGVVYDFFVSRDTTTDTTRSSRGRRRQPPAIRRTGHVVRMKFENAASSTASYGVQRSDAYYNYFIGRDTNQWATRVPAYERVVTRGIYDGIDAVHYTDGGYPRYDLVVQPGADPSQIRMKIEGANRVRVDNDGQLRMESSIGDLYQGKPFAYQEINGRRVEVSSAFNRIDNEHVRFTMGRYDQSRPLIIDPVVYSTYLGGSGDDMAHDVAVDDEENVYVVGWVKSSDFPVTAGAYDESANDDWDISLSRLRNDGMQLDFSTFIGTTDQDYGTAIVLGDTAIYLSGTTFSSSSFPTPNGFASTGDGFQSVVVANVSLDGSRLNSATYLAGNITENSNDIGLNSTGKVCVVGETNSSDYPTANALQGSRGGISANVDGFVTLLSADLSSLEFSTYIGMAQDDYIHGVAIDGDDHIHVAGGTKSDTFYRTVDGYDTTFNSSGTENDVFYLKLEDDGSQILYSTFLGGSNEEEAYAITVDAAGNAYLSGYTMSSNFPTGPGTVYQSSFGGTQDAFVTKFSSSGSLDYSTYLGGSGTETVYAISVDADGRAYVCGATTGGFPVIAGSFDESYGTGGDGFASVFSSAGDSLKYSTYLGGSRTDGADAVAVVSTNQIIVAGATKSADFPVTPYAYQVQNADTGAVVNDIFVLRLYTVADTNSNHLRGVVNTYRPVTDVESCGECIYVQKPGVGENLGFEADDRILIMQMTGARLDERNQRTFGAVESYGSAGLYEFATISSVSDATLDGVTVTCIEVETSLSFAYSPRTDPVQIIRVPQYDDVVIVGGTLTAKPWDGASGGVVVFEASGTVTVIDDINVSGKGFRGGDPSALYSGGTELLYDYVLDDVTEQSSGMKGEGIGRSGNTGYVYNDWMGREPTINGGGGGNLRAGGGGGGSNLTAGGNGGRQATQPEDDCFPANVGGLGGYALEHDYWKPYRVFLGGGGGGGQITVDDAVPSQRFAGAGGAGGGIIIIRAQVVTGQMSGSERPKLWSAGAPGGMSIFAGGGGGGAGGTIVLGSGNITGDFSISYRGGDGGRAWGNYEYCYGPGGGGGAGMARFADYDTDHDHVIHIKDGGAAGDLYGWLGGTSYGNIPCHDLGTTYGATAGGSEGATHFGDQYLPGTPMPMSMMLQEPAWWEAGSETGFASVMTWNSDVRVGAVSISIISARW